jgi:undecaprenyl-diphosphatase
LLFICRILSKIDALKTTKIFFPVAAVLLIALSFLLDAPVRAFVITHQTPALHEAAALVSRYGAWQWLMLAMVLCLAWAAKKQDKELKRLLITMMIVSSIAGLLADTTRGLTGRTRPNSGIEPGWYGVYHDSHWLIGNSRYNAFPSGHTAASTGLIAPLLLLRRRFRWLLLSVPLIIASSRIYLGAHHPSDVVAGATVGLGVAWIWIRYGASYAPTALRPPLLTSKTSRLTGQAESL